LFFIDSFGSGALFPCADIFHVRALSFCPYPRWLRSPTAVLSTLSAPLSTSYSFVYRRHMTTRLDDGFEVCFELFLSVVLAKRRL
jgi:hypothetical protein